MYYCKRCGRTFNMDEILWKCPCGYYLCYKNERGIIANDIVDKNHSLWRYKGYFPYIDLQNIVSLGEGMTPIIKEELFGFDVYLKEDYIQPTGSFKDRGVAVIVSFLKQMGIKKVIEDSSGNAGASLATYCVRAGIKCRIYVPHSTSENKISQIRVMGAEIIKVKGSRDDVAMAAMNDGDGFYASHNWNPLFIEGVKSIAFEIWEQLGKAPDNVIAPLGYGSMVLGAGMGFLELQRAGIITKMPRIHAVQTENCSPMYDYYNDKEPVSCNKVYRDTIAEGIAARNPIRKEEIKGVIDESSGSISLVSEEEIKDALKLSLNRGIFIEPTSAVAIAGFKKLCNNKKIKEKDINVVCLTGWGMKDFKSLMEIL